MPKFKNSSTKLTVKGFTLIELVVVVGIIGILAVIVTSYLGTARNKGDDTRRVADIKQIQTALGLYYDSHQNYPPTLNLLVTDNDIASLPIPPSGTGETSYKYSALGNGSNCNDYHIGVTFEDVSSTILNSDTDAVAGSVCDESASDFSGADPVYDVKP